MEISQSSVKYIKIFLYFHPLYVNFHLFFNSLVFQRFINCIVFCQYYYSPNSDSRHKNFGKLPNYKSNQVQF